MAVNLSPEKVFEACLVELHKSMRAASFYSLDHPALLQSTERTLRYFQNLLRVYERLEFTIQKTQILYEDKPLVGQNQVLTALAGEFFRRRMKKVIFLPGITQHDLLGFLRAIKIDPDSLADKGGMEKMLAKFGVKSIWPNEVDFSRLDEIEEEEEEEEEEQLDFNLTPEQKELRELLQQMLRSDDTNFMRLLKEVMDRSNDLSASGQYSEVGVTLDYLFKYVADARKTMTTREFAEKAIRALATKDVLQVKIEQLMKASDEERVRLTMMFQYIGKVTIPFLITALAFAEDRISRRNLSRTVMDFGAKAAPRAVEMLHDERWFVKRNMLVILGEIGSGENLDSILPLAHSSDVRVSKEAVKTIGRIGGESGLTTLNEQLEELAPLVQVQVALLFGGRRWSAGVPKLEVLASKSNKLDEVRVAACDALGKIADPGSFRTLSRIYRSRGFFQRAKRLPIRRAALKALVNYGSLAEPLLLKAVKESDTEMQGIARIALERLIGDGAGVEVGNEVRSD